MLDKRQKCPDCSGPFVVLRLSVIAVAAVIARAAAVIAVARAIIITGTAVIARATVIARSRTISVCAAGCGTGHQGAGCEAKADGGAATTTCFCRLGGDGCRAQ